MSSIHFSSASNACPAQISPASRQREGRGSPGGCPWGTGVPAAPSPSPPRYPQAFCSEGGCWRGQGPGTLPTHPCAGRCCSNDV